MKILAIETSGALGSVALWAPNEPAGLREFSTQQEACRRLPLAVQELLAGQPLAGIGLSGLAVSQGPGSFNGLRIGIAFAKAIAHALDLPIVGVPTPAAWAAEALERAAAPCAAVLQPARRDHVYLTVLSPDTLMAAEPPTEVVAVADLPTRLQAVSGDTALPLTGDWPDLDAFAAQHHFTRPDADRRLSPSAAVLARLAEPSLAAAPRETHFTLRPAYLSRSQAERSLGVDLGQ